MNRCELAEEIISVIGKEAAMRLFNSHGGMVVKIPTGTGKGGAFVQQLIELIGETGYKSLIARFGGERLAIPKGKAMALLTRNRAIVADYCAGSSSHELVRRYRLTMRQIRTILSSPTEPDITPKGRAFGGDES